ncbi:MAG: SPOR domain-containing protein [Rickettsiales bacterium]
MGKKSTKFKLFIFFNLILFSACSTKNPALTEKRKIPEQNKIFLAKPSLLYDSSKPITKPQNAFINNQNNNTPIKLYDEVANNNIKELKKSLTQQNNKHNNLKKIVPSTTKEVNTVKEEKGFFIQIGAYSNRNNAEKVERTLSKNFSKVFAEKKTQGNLFLTKIKLGPYYTLSEANNILTKVKSSGFHSSIIINNK